jgi:hypothetical protein
VGGEQGEEGTYIAQILLQDRAGRVVDLILDATDTTTAGETAGVSRVSRRNLGIKIGEEFWMGGSLESLTGWKV